MTEGNISPEDERFLTTHELKYHSGPLWGALAISLVLASMAVGPCIPLAIIATACIGHLKVAASAAALTVGSMAVAGYSPSFCRFFLNAAGWFRKGAYLHFEKGAIVAFGKSPSMWCMHPHGTAVGLGFTLNGAIRFRALQPDQYVPPLVHEVLTDAREANCNGVMAPVLFNIPLLRNVLLAFGCCTPATKKDMFGLMKKGLDFGILPGGMEEVALYAFQKERIFIRNRAGFIKYGLQHGYQLLLGYTFGESDLYRNMVAGSSMRLWMQKNLGFVIPVFWGPFWYAPWLPDPEIPVHTVIGSPIKLPKIENPTAEEVSEWQKKYMDGMEALFEAHKTRFGYQDRKLELL